MRGGAVDRGVIQVFKVQGGLGGVTARLRETRRLT